DPIGTAAHLVLELVVGGGGDLDVDADAAPGIDEELVAQAAPGAGVPRVEGEVQRLPGGGIDAIRVARLAEQRPGPLEIDPPEGIQVGPLVPEDAGRDHGLRGDAATVQEDVHEGPAVDDQAHPLLQLAAAIPPTPTDHPIP